MKCALQDMMNSYKAASLLRPNIVLANNTCLVAMHKKIISVSLTLLFLLFFFSFTTHFGAVSAQHRLDPHECILVYGNYYISSKIFL